MQEEEEEREEKMEEGWGGCVGEEGGEGMGENRVLRKKRAEIL